MAVTIAGASPSFDKEFNNIISISNYTNKVLVPNKDTIAIPTDSLGANEDFSEATVTFYVLDASEVVTTNWTISLSSSTNCTASVSDGLKTATVSAITANTANFVVKASKTGESDLFRLITVYKAKEGVDGSGTPDDETIVLDGSSNLKVDNHTLYNDGSEFSDTLLIGAGAVDLTTSPTSTVGSNNIFIQSDPTATSGSTASNNIIGIGNNVTLFPGLTTTYTVNTNGIIIGNDLSMRLDYSNHNTVDNFIVCGLHSATGSMNRFTNDSITIGLNPNNILENSTAISFDKNANASWYPTQNDRYFVSRHGRVGTSSSVDFDLDLSTLNIQGNGLIKAVMTIIGSDYPGGDVYNEEVYMVISNDTLLVNYSDTNKKFTQGTMSTLTVTHSYISGGTIRVNVTTTTEQGNFYINFDILSVE